MELVKAKQYALDGRFVEKTISIKFLPGESSRLRKMVEDRTCHIQCNSCDKWIREDRICNSLHYYISPWDSHPEQHEYFCSDKCYEEAYYSDWSPQYCQECDRDIIQRNPENGWRSYFLSDPEYKDGDLICVACWQKKMIRYGHWDWHFEDDVFIHCDFFNHDELEEAGYQKLKGGWFFIRDITSKKEWAEFCKNKMNEGYQLVTDLNSSGMNLEGTIQVWGKKNE